MNELPWIKLARAYLGLKEVKGTKHNPTITHMLDKMGSDRKWLKDHPELIGWRGYLNRVGWLRRNRLYGLKRFLAVDYTDCTTRKFRGDPAISDKHKIAGWLFVTARCHTKKLEAFEWYSVTPYTKNRCLRVRLGWKIKGDKFDEVGEFGSLVFTINPFDTYGDD